MAVKPPRDPQDVGYTWPTILAVAVHLLVVIFSLVKLPSMSAEPDSSSIVQATFVSTETFTDQAQQVTEQQAAMNNASEPEEPDPEPPSDEPSAAEQQAAAEAAQREAEAEAAEQARALEQAQAEAEAEA
ncbi:MAG: protein TolA, partial [Pseudomonadota bacterium]|nr:protein TolA [Pseudomonadota bacterium]